MCSEISSLHLTHPLINSRSSSVCLVEDADWIITSYVCVLWLMSRVLTWNIHIRTFHISLCIRSVKSFRIKLSTAIRRTMMLINKPVALTTGLLGPPVLKSSWVSLWRIWSPSSQLKQVYNVHLYRSKQGWPTVITIWVWQRNKHAPPESKHTYAYWVTLR